jgi:hypothetical protein
MVPLSNLVIKHFGGCGGSCGGCVVVVDESPFPFSISIGVVVCVGSVCVVPFSAIVIRNSLSLSAVLHFSVLPLNSVSTLSRFFNFN